MANPFPKVPTRLALPENPPDNLNEVVPYLKSLTAELQSYVNQLANYINTANLADVIANQPPAGLAGRTFYGTDNSHFYVDDGTSWITVV